MGTNGSGSGCTIRERGGGHEAVDMTEKRATTTSTNWSVMMLERLISGTREVGCMEERRKEGAKRFRAGIRPPPEGVISRDQREFGYSLFFGGRRQQQLLPKMTR